MSKDNDRDKKLPGLPIPESDEERLNEIFVNLKDNYGLMMRLADLADLLHMKEGATRVAIFRDDQSNPAYSVLKKSAFRFGKKIQWYTLDVSRAILTGNKAEEELAAKSKDKEKRGENMKRNNTAKGPKNDG